jgi:cytochrome c
MRLRTPAPAVALVASLAFGAACAPVEDETTGQAEGAATFEGESPEAVAKRNGCMGCHAVDRLVVGPSFENVARAYVNDPSAEATLIEKAKRGGVGQWGRVPMPPLPLGNDDAQLIVRWILNTNVTRPAPGAATKSGMAALRSASCDTCHKLDGPLVGPSYRAIADAYAAKPARVAKAVMFKSVRLGSKDKWGVLPMPPPSPNVTDADIASAIDAIQSLSPPPPR